MRPKSPNPNRVLVSVRLTPDLVDQLHSYCRAQTVQPERTRVIETALRTFLEREAQPARQQT